MPASGDACYLERMAADSKTLAGWLPGHDARWVIATVLVVAGLLWVKSDGLSSRIDDLRRDVTSQIAELRIDLRRIDDRLRAVEIAVQPAAPTPDE